MFSLVQFYSLMDESSLIRKKITKDILDGKKPDKKDIDRLKEIKETLLSIEGVDENNYKGYLLLTEHKKIEVDLSYEIEELKKDLIYLEKGEESLFQYFERLYPDFDKKLNKLIEEFPKDRFFLFATDRDGTINNYCGRYRTSIQSIYNGVFLSEFAKKKTTNSIILTSAPMKSPGILDVVVIPEGVYILSASKGREFVDKEGKRHTYPIKDEEKELLDRLFERIKELVSKEEYRKFSLIGSGLQYKFGQVTIARQDISHSIPDRESLEFLNIIRSVVKELDPEGKFFTIVDTGLDIEIILTIEGGEGRKEFTKGDGLLFILDKLSIDIKDKVCLIAGDTSSDIALLEAVLKREAKPISVFITKDNGLIEKVNSLCKNSYIIPYVDLFVTSLYFLAKN